jgi:hypothetical protein
MRYLVILRSESATGNPPPELMEAIMRLGAEATNAGSLLDTAGLAPSAAGARVELTGGSITVTDGPFAEAKEFLAGYWIVEVDRPERAYQIAAEASAAPGKGGEPLNMAIEVRQVMSAPPVDV